MRFFLYACMLAATVAVWGATLTQVVSHENPLCHPDSGGARLTVGRDGLVYISHGGQPNGFVLRLAPDGTGKTGGAIMYCTNGLAANADGIMVSADAHFTHAMNLLDRSFRQYAAFNEIVYGDNVGWDAPRWVEAGAGGDFYGMDQYRNRLVRVSPAGKLVATYPIKADGEKMPSPQEFRVCEKGNTFYWLANRTVYCSGQDGVTRWSVPAPVSGNPWDGFHGGYDVSEDGTLSYIDQKSLTIIQVGPDGKALAPIVLKDAALGDFADGYISDLRIFNGKAIIKRRHPSELFRAYDLRTGTLLAAPQIDFEKLTVTCPDVWTAGATVPFTLTFAVGARPVAPRWRVWVRPVGTLQYRELAWKDGQLQVPTDLAGLYQLKVSPETRPHQWGTPSEYLVRDVVDIRPMGQFGMAVVSTAGNRTVFRADEPIDFTIAFRGGAVPGEGQATVNILDERGKPALRLPLEPGGKSTVTCTLRQPLAAGTYACTVVAPFFTAVPHYFTVGWGRPSRFKLVQYGDYSSTYPGGDFWNAPDATAAAAHYDARLGLNLKVDRLGHPLQAGALQWENHANAEIEALAKRIEADPAATPSLKLRSPAPFLQSMARYSAAGIDQMAILMGNDAGLPIGTSFDQRTKEQFAADITRVTNALKPFPAFRGWSWSSNWWVGKTGANAATNDAERQAFTDAVKAMKQTGAWNPALDMISYAWLSFAVQAQGGFTDALRQAAPGKVTAVAAPYRHVYAYPPMTFSNVDEVDLHIQWEQMNVPYFAPHNVDYYKRPGKPAWGHPEVWNDSGTGDQILPTLFQMVMRGADGVGFSGLVYNWGPQPEDSRQSYNGLASIFRAGNGLLAAYGPWLTTLKPRDRVAIVADSRMFRLDEWTKNVWGDHFARVKEAYATLLHAHRPASLVFVEDMKPETLAAYKAVLLVDQRVEMEPQLVAALDKAKAAGTAIFFDDTCRPELMKGFTPLGVAFNHFENDPSAAGDDSAYWRFSNYCKANLPAVTRALSNVLPTADTPNDEVFVSERISGDGRFLFVLDNITPQIDPGKLWRATLCVTSRVPVIAPVKLDTAKAVYDCFALKAVTPQGGWVNADLRNLPLRVYALLPAAIDAVALKAPKAVAAGESYAWSVTVTDATGKPINAGIPVRVRALLPDGTVLQEQSVSAEKTGATGTFTLPVNIATVTLEAQELVSGKVATVAIAVAPKAGTAVATVGKAARLADAAELRFGPHIKDIAVGADGTALLNAMNWDSNLYALDTATGAVRWQRKVGDYFAFAPQALPTGFAVQGFDFATAEGYHLYLLDKNGTPERRFALYGLSRRLPQRFVAGMFNDQMNSFATNGAWVAAAGDLGVAAWSRDGKPALTRDAWPANRATARWKPTDAWGSVRLSTPTVAALDTDTLLVADGVRLTAYRLSGDTKWQRTLGSNGEVRKILTGPRGLVLLQTTTEGGRVVVLNGDQLVADIPCVCDDVALAPDGTRFIAIQKNMVKLYSIAQGLQWVFPADDHARNPRFAPDGRLAVTTDIGTVYVLNADGAPLLERDLGALAVPAWLPGGDLLLATWMGRVTRLDEAYKARWNTVLRPAAVVADPAPATARVNRWGNAEATPAPIAPNALGKAPVLVTFLCGGRAVEMQQKADALFDGKPDAPLQPWLGWHHISWLGEGSAFNTLQFDFFRTRLRATGITFTEDPAHPESWLRDAYLEYWDTGKEEWVFVQPLLSDAAVHTHLFKQPVEAAKFRFVLPPGLVGNLRLGEITLHGELLGASHADAGKALATLFDETEAQMPFLMGGNSVASFKFGDAFSGRRYLACNPGQAGPAWTPPFGHCLPDWDFEIAENPKPGQFRWLQFAWKALDAKTDGMQLLIGGAWPGGGVGVTAGKSIFTNGVIADKKLAVTPPTGWTVVRVDLWDAVKRPLRLQALSLAASGGAAAFDAIVLGRTEADLPAMK
jgi:outer membrane protein assembly factor BamB